jgi:putative membrane protein
MMMGFGLLGLLLIGGLLLALLVGGAGLVLRETGGSSQGQSRSRQPTARQVLDERFARGEISREEYEAIRAHIEG